MKSTDEKLRELVASWTWRSRVFESDYEHEQGKSNAYLMCADELLSILDTQPVRKGVTGKTVDAGYAAFCGRKNFEAWVMAQPWFIATVGLSRCANRHDYNDATINSRWQGWQAALAYAKRKGWEG